MTNIRFFPDTDGRVSTAWRLIVVPAKEEKDAKIADYQNTSTAITITTTSTSITITITAISYTTNAYYNNVCKLLCVFHLQIISNKLSHLILIVLCNKCRYSHFTTRNSQRLNELLQVTQLIHSIAYTSKPKFNIKL